MSGFAPAPGDVADVSPNPKLEAWGDELCVVRRLAGGHRNQVWLCAGPDGPLVAKSTRRSAAALAWLDPVHGRAEAAGFVVPRLVFTRNGALVADGWTLERWLEGRPVEGDDIPRVRSALAAFHQLGAAIGQRPGFATTHELIRRDASGDVDLDDLPLELRAVCRDAWTALADMPLAAIHGDLSRDNILIAADGRPILLDWDEARRDATAFDWGALGEGCEPAPLARARLAYEVACCWKIEPVRARALAARLNEDMLSA